VGVVEKRGIINGSRIEAGDTVIGLASSGLHSNGFSLVRKALSQKQIKAMSAQLLRPTRIYVRPVRIVLQRLGSSVHGIAHITGGAFYDKIARILPSNVDVRIDKGSWPIPHIFRIVQEQGDIADKEMYHTLNMGIGMVLVAPTTDTRKVIGILKKHRVQSWIIGKAIKGKGQVEVT